METKDLVEKVLEKLESEIYQGFEGEKLYGAISKDRVSMLVMETDEYFKQCGLKEEHLWGKDMWKNVNSGTQVNDDIDGDEFARMLDLAKKINSRILLFNSEGMHTDPNEMPYKIHYLAWKLDTTDRSFYSVPCLEMAKPMLRKSDYLKLRWGQDYVLIIEGMVGGEKFYYLVAPRVED